MKNKLQKKKNIIKNYIKCAIIVSIIIRLSLGGYVFADEYKYDENNRVTEVIHDDGSVTVYEYDANGNIISTKFFDSEKQAEEYISQGSDDEQTIGNNTEDDKAGGNTKSEDVINDDSPQNDVKQEGQGDGIQNDVKQEGQGDGTKNDEKQEATNGSNENDEIDAKTTEKDINYVDESDKSTGSGDTAGGNGINNSDDEIITDKNNNSGDSVQAYNNSELVDVSGNSAKTSDNSPLFTLAVIMALSAASIIGLMIIRHKRKDI